MARNIPVEEIQEFLGFPTFHKHQREYATTQAKYPLTIGAVGSGKSLAGICRGIFLSANTPYFGDLAGNVGLIGRLKRTDLEDTTMDDFFELLDPSGWIKSFDKRRFKVTLINTSTIQFVPMEELHKFTSRNLGWALLEQIEEIKEKIWEEIAIRRIRRTVTLTGNVVNFRSVFGIANPCENWVFDTWGENEDLYTSKDPEERKKFDPNYLTFHSSTYENAEFLPPDYISEMEKKYGGKNSKKGKMYLQGLWGSLAGSIYDWDDKYVNEKDNWKDWTVPTILGLDYGWGTEGVTSFSFITAEKLDKGRTAFEVYDELYLVHSTIEESVEALDNMLQYHAVKRSEKSQLPLMEERQPVLYCIYDPSMSKVLPRPDRASKEVTEIDEFRNRCMERDLKIAFIPGNNKIALGTDRVNWLFVNDLLRFNPRCTHHRKSFKNYVWDEDDTTKPKKGQDDHPCDDVRYPMVHVVNVFKSPRQQREKTLIERVREKRLALRNRSRIELGAYV